MQARKKVLEYYNGLPGWARGIVIVGGIGVAWFGILNPIRKVIISKLDLGKKVQEGKEAGDELLALRKKGIVPTMNDAQAESFANALRVGFSNCGTDESAIYRVMANMKNEADIMLLIRVYGIRKYVDCPVWSLGLGSGTTEQTLSGAISDELDSIEKATVNGILKKNGIKFQFA